MSKKDEALKLALEALEKCDSALAEELAAWDIDPPLHHVLEASNACGPAITAIREALAEQPAQQQEPDDTDWDAVLEKLIEVWSRQISADEGLDEIQDLIYTSPPASKPWLGLSRDELEAGSQIEDAKSGAALDLSTAFWAGARWAEAKLKEKNA